MFHGLCGLLAQAAPAAAALPASPAVELPWYREGWAL